MRLVWLFLALSSHAKLPDVKQEYYYPNFDTEFPSFPPEVTAKRINAYYEFTLTEESNFETYYVYGPDKKFDFDIAYDEATLKKVEFKLEFDTASGVVVELGLRLSNGYMVTTLVDGSNDPLCYGTEKKIPFYLNFETKTVSCGTLVSPIELPITGLLNGQVFDTDNGMKIVPLVVSWKVRGTKMFWKFPAVSMPFHNSRRPKPPTVAPTTTTTTTPQSTITTPSTDDADTTEAPEEKKTSSAGFPIWAYIVIAAAVFAALSAIAVVSIVIYKKRHTKVHVSPDDIYPQIQPDDANVPTNDRPSESADKGMPPPSSVSKMPSSVSKVPSSSKPIPAPAPKANAKPARAKRAKAANSKAAKSTKTVNNEKTTELTFEGRSSRMEQSPGQDIDKLVEQASKKGKSQRTESIFE